MVPDPSPCPIHLPKRRTIYSQYWCQSQKYQKGLILNLGWWGKDDCLCIQQVEQIWKRLLHQKKGAPGCLQICAILQALPVKEKINSVNWPSSLSIDVKLQDTQYLTISYLDYWMLECCDMDIKHRTRKAHCNNNNYYYSTYLDHIGWLITWQRQYMCDNIS
jgi:hypothetical protein